MKKKELNELRTKTLKELSQLITRLEGEKNDILIQLKMGKTKNVHLVAKKKKDIAKAKTLEAAKSVLEEKAKILNQSPVGKKGKENNAAN